jgi:hypothetical protein
MTAESSSSSPGTSELSPKKVKGIHSALVRYRVMAWITGVFLATLTIALVVLWAKGYDSAQRAEIGWYNVGWTLHGFLYIVYLLTTVDLFTRVRWPFWAGILIALAGTIPFASFFAERWVSNDVRRRFPQVEV